MVGLLWPLLAPAIIAADPSDHGDEIGSTGVLEWELLEAETAVAQGEPRIAASHYRGAAKEAWYLLGLIALAEGDLETGGEALSRGRNAAAAELERVRMALSLVELRLGEVERPLRELRFLAIEDRLAIGRQQRLAEALAALGRRDELAEQLGVLRGLDSAAADALEARIYQSAQGTLPFPEPDLGLVATLGTGKREPLRSRLVATLQRTYHNLATLHRRTAFGDGAALDAVAEELAAKYPQAAEPFGKLNLAVVDPPPSVTPPSFDLVALTLQVPAALREVLSRIDRGEAEAAEQRLRQLAEAEDGATAQALLGRWLAYRGELDEARQVLLAAVERAPEPADARQDLARLAWLEGSRGKALDHLRRAAELGLLDRDLAMVLADAELAEGNWTSAETQLRSLEKRFESVEAMLRLSREQSRAESPRAPTASTTRPTTRPTTRMRPSARRPTTSREQSDRKKRVFEATSRALQYAPNSEEVLLVHTRMALAIGIESSAERTVEALVRMRPDVAEYHWLIGRFWAHRRHMAEASESFLAALAIDPDYAPAFLPLALAFNHGSRYADAKPYFERRLALDPDDIEALAGLAEAEERLGDREVAGRLVSRVLELSPRHARAQLVLAMLRLGDGALDEARQALERSVDSDPLLAKAHYQLSLVCIRLGDRDCAKEHQKLFERVQAGPEASYVQLEAAGAKGMTLRSGAEKDE